MSGNWSRRSLLASVGTITIAGSASNATRHSSPQADPVAPSRIDSEWPMPAHDPGLSNATSQAAGPTEPVAELWQVSTGTALSTPVVADGTLYVGGDDGVVRAFDARTGEDRWQQSVGPTAHAPRVMGDLVYVPTTAAIVALDASDGTEIWRADTSGRADTVDRTGDVERATVLVASHGVYWLANDENPTVVSLARDDGSEHWRTEIHDPWTRRLFASDDSIFVSTHHNGRVPWALAADTGAVLDGPAETGADFEDERFYRDGTIYAVDQIFGRMETRAVDDQGRAWNQGLPPGGYASSGGQNRVYTNVNGGESPGLYALSVTDGTLDWSTNLAGAASRPVVADETVLVQTRDRLRCFDPADGTERWARPNLDVGERVIVASDLVYTTHDDTVRAFR